MHVWSCDLSRQEGERAALAALLSTEEQTRAARFVFELDRQRFILSHGLLRLILARYVEDAAGQLEFETEAHGKPVVLRRSGTGRRSSSAYPTQANMPWWRWRMGRRSAWI